MAAKKAAAAKPGGRSAQRNPRNPRNQRLNAPELVKVLLTVEEAAHTLSIGRTACYRLMKRGELRYILIGSTRRVPVDAVTEFVARAMRASA